MLVTVTPVDIEDGTETVLVEALEKPQMMIVGYL